MPSSGLQRKVTCCMYTACASAASEEGLQHSDVNKGLDMHTVTVRGATCNEHRARSPPRTAGTPADMTCKAEHKHLLLLGKVWQTSCSSGCNAAPPGPAGRADLPQRGRPGWHAAHLRADRRSGAFGTGCKLQPCLQRAAARRAGALLPSAACTLRTWEASPECMLIASRSVGERPTPQAYAAGRREERAPRRAQQAVEGSTTFHGVRAIFIFETTSFRVRNHIFSVTGQSASGRLQRGWGGLGGGWRREHYWYSNPQHTSMTVSTRACRGRAASPNTSSARDARAGLLGSRPPAPVQTASRALEFPANSLKLAGKASQLNLAGNSTTRREALSRYQSRDKQFDPGTRDKI